jgi:hypothetical protein
MTTVEKPTRRNIKPLTEKIHASKPGKPGPSLPEQRLHCLCSFFDRYKWIGPMNLIDKAAERIEQYDRRQPHCVNSGQAKAVDGGRMDYIGHG